MAAFAGQAQPSVSLSLWYLPALSSSEAECLRQDLSPAEQVRLQAMSSPGRQRSYLAGHVLLRRLLSSLIPDWSQEHVFTLSADRDQLLLQGPLAQELDFNLSHSGDWIAAIIGRHCRVGVDVEVPSRKRSCRELAEAFFSPQEVQQLHLLPDDRQLEHFYRLWTLKESYLKACKSGLSSVGLKTTFAEVAAYSESCWFAYPFTLAAGDSHCQPVVGAVTLSQPLLQPLPILSWQGQGFDTLAHVHARPYCPQP